MSANSNVTPETLVGHELVGLSARVAAAPNPDLVGIEGPVVRETTRTLHVETGRIDGSPTTKQIPKADTTFELCLSDSPSGPLGGPDGESEWVTVAGERLVGRPARRTERDGDSKWR